MIRTRSSSTQVIPSSFMCLDGLIIRNEKSRMSHENPNSILNFFCEFLFGLVEIF
jgi:hypothetical protein